MKDVREMEPDRFFFLHSRAHPNPVTPNFPLTVVMSTSVFRCTFRRDVARFLSARRLHTEPRPLKTPEDWADFQLERASYKRLSEYTTTMFHRVHSLLVHSRPLLRTRLKPDKGKYLSATPRTSPSSCSFTTLPLCTPRLRCPLWTFKVSHEPKLYALRIWCASRDHCH
jgi:hypothetical protein